MSSKPTSVRHNDWRQVAVDPVDTFTPTLPVSVIMPSYQTPVETLARTLAALEGQTYPRDLFEVIIADDGSEPPISRPSSTPLDVKVVRQERRGFGAAKARNLGARAASGDILLFLDNDVLAEAGWMVAHARWHHAVSDALTIGPCVGVSVEDVDEEAIRRRMGTLTGLFSDRRSDPPWTDSHMVRTDDLTSRADDIFRVVASGNLGVGRGFYESTGGFEESFTGYGMEDTEFGYRAYTCGGLLVPVRDALAWHQGRWKDNNREAKDRSFRFQRAKAANLIAHPGFRAPRPGLTFDVPQYVVTIDAGHSAAEPIIAVTANVLADRVRDLVVRIETPEGDGGGRAARFRDEFGSDPRVRVCPPLPDAALDEFPASPFHVALPVSTLATDLVHRLRAALGSAVTATSTLPDGSTVSITRACALHRARRAGGSPADFGEARTIPAAALKLKNAEPVIPNGAQKLGYDGQTLRSARDDIGETLPTKWVTLLGWVRDVRRPSDAWRLLKGLAAAVRWRVAIKQ